MFTFRYSVTFRLEFPEYQLVNERFMQGMPPVMKQCRAWGDIAGVTGFTGHFKIELDHSDGLFPPSAA